WAHVDDLRGSRVPDRTRATDTEQRVAVDGELGVIDMGVIVLRAVEHHHPTLEGVRVGGVAEIPLPELLRDHARLHDGGVEEVAFEHEEATVGLQWPVVRPDDIRVHDLSPATIVADGAAVDRERALTNEAALHQL